MGKAVPIDDELMSQLVRQAQGDGVSVGQLASRLLRQALVEYASPATCAAVTTTNGTHVPFVQLTFDMGTAKIDIDKATQLAADLRTSIG
jgi:hypothetical protein